MSNRVIYQVLGLYSGPNNPTGAHFSSGNSGINLINQFQRVQTVSHSWNVNRTAINQFGQLGAISREIVDAPTVSLSTSWYPVDLSNEREVGFYTSGDFSAIRYFLDKTQDTRNYFLAKAPEGQDLYSFSGQSQVIQITNASVSSYSTEGAVGGIPTCSLSVDALNWAVSTGSFNQSVRAVNPINGLEVTGLNYTIPTGTTGAVGSVAALRPGDITVSIGSAALGLTVSDLKIQSYNISFDLARDNLQQLGSRFAFSKEIQFPVTVSASVTANIGDFNTGSLADILCNDIPYNLFITLRDPSCTGNGPIAMQYAVKGVKIDSQEFTNDIGSNSAVTINYSTQLSGPGDTTIGLFMSGKQGF